jgi:urease accessory protein
MPAPRMAMTMTAEPVVEPLANPGLYRLLAWLSPSFPIGAYSYSHGLEAAVADGVVRDRVTLAGWIAAVVTEGSGRIDADILCATYRAAAAGNLRALDAANQRGLAFRSTAELALEATQQGEAFLATCRAAWPDDFIAGWSADAVCHSAAFGAIAARAAIALKDALLGNLHAFAANLVSAGLRLGIIGQTDGQRILAALEPVVGGAAEAALTRDIVDFGAATFAVDLASMAHETQYSRLFRS